MRTFYFTSVPSRLDHAPRGTSPGHVLSALTLNLSASATFFERKPLKHSCGSTERAAAALPLGGPCCLALDDKYDDKVCPAEVRARRNKGEKITLRRCRTHLRIKRK